MLRTTKCSSGEMSVLISLYEQACEWEPCTPVDGRDCLYDFSTDLTRDIVSLTWACLALVARPCRTRSDADALLPARHKRACNSQSRCYSSRAVRTPNVRPSLPVGCAISQRLERCERMVIPKTRCRCVVGRHAGTSNGNMSYDFSH
jgi:hypothetical protein